MKLMWVRINCVSNEVKLKLCRNPNPNHIPIHYCWFFFYIYMPCFDIRKAEYGSKGGRPVSLSILAMA